MHSRTRLFGRDGDGAQEILELIGVISAGVSFDKWEPLFPFGIRDVSAIVGRSVVLDLADVYNAEEGEQRDLVMSIEGMEEALTYLRQAVALFTWLKIIPTLDAQHDENGRSRRLGENEKGLTALQEWKDEQNILRLAYEAVDALIETMTIHHHQYWLDSPKYSMRKSLLVRNKEEFDEYYNIGSHRLFVTLLPMLREIQQGSVAPIVGSDRMRQLVGGDSLLESILGDTARRALVLLTMEKAIRRLPVEVMPEGIVQVQFSQPVSSRLKADKEARQAVADSLAADGGLALSRLADLVAGLEQKENRSSYVGGPIVHSKGISF